MEFSWNEEFDLIFQIYIYLKIFKNICAFEQEPIIAYRCNQNLGVLIGSKDILDDKVESICSNKKQLYCRPLLTRRDNICTEQI